MPAVRFLFHGPKGRGASHLRPGPPFHPIGKDAMNKSAVREKAQEARAVRLLYMRVLAESTPEVRAMLECLQDLDAYTFEATTPIDWPNAKTAASVIDETRMRAQDLLTGYTDVIRADIRLREETAKRDAYAARERVKAHCPEIKHIRPGGL